MLRVLSFGLAVIWLVTHLVGPSAAKTSFKWVNLPELVNDPLFKKVDCNRSDYVDSAGALLSGRYDNALKIPEHGNDAVDQVTGDPIDRSELEDVLDHVQVQYFCVLGDMEGRQLIKQTITHFAKNDLLKRGKGDEPSDLALYTVTRFVSQWATIFGQTDITDAEANLINSWLKRRLKEFMPIEPKQTTKCGSKVTGNTNDNCNNWDAVATYAISLFGALTDDKSYFDYGKKRLLAHLAAVRKDGSLPQDAKRGCRALLYSRYSVGTYSAIAEVYSRKGIDLYKENKISEPLTRAFEYLVKVTDDNSLIVKYANFENRMSADHRDGCTDKKQVRPGLEHYYELWPLVLRTPDSPVSKRVKKGLEEAGQLSAINYDTATVPYLWAKHSSQ